MGQGQRTQHTHEDRGKKQRGEDSRRQVPVLDQSLSTHPLQAGPRLTSRTTAF